MQKQEDKGMQDPSYFLEIFDIAKYAVYIEDEKTYRKASRMLSEKMHAYVTLAIQQNEVGVKGLDFLPIHIDLMKQILNMVSKPYDNFFTHDCWLLEVWFNTLQYTPLSEDTLCFIWYFVTNIIDAGKEDWFMSYWTFADQYFRSTFDLNNSGCDDKNIMKQKSRFKQMHLGLGAYILYKKRYSLLNKILKFTQTMPPSYCLTDNTFCMILEDMGRIYELYECPLILTRKYMMSGLMNDINSDSYIVGKFNAYFALLMVRLNNMDYNVSYSDPKRIPSIDCDSDISELKKQLRYVGVLKHFLEDKELIQCLSKVELTDDQRTECQNLLDSYQKKLEDCITEKNNNPQTDSKKLEYIKNNLVEELKKQKLQLPQKQDSLLTDNIKVEVFYCKQSCVVPKEDIAKSFNRISANMEEALIAYMLTQERQIYNRFFLYNKPVVSYTIRFKDLMRAFEKLKVDKNIVILSMGVYLGTFSDLYGKHDKFKYVDDIVSFNGAKILEMQSTMRAFIIVPKDSLPYVEHATLDSEHNDCDKRQKNSLSCICPDGYLYSNVDAIDATQNRILTVLRKVKLISKADLTKFIVFRIDHSNDSSQFDLEKIQGIENYVQFSKK